MANFTDIVIISTYFILLFLSIFWLIVLFATPKKEEERKITKYSDFTTIVPAYNEEKSITETLTSLINLDYPKDKLSIIVVNDGSTDKTLSLVEKFIKHNPSHNITLINQKNQGKARAMNNGLKLVKSEFFACLDADSFVTPPALKRMLPFFEDTQVASVCPLLKVKKPNTLLQKVQWYEYIINMFYRYLNAQINCIHVTPGPFSIYRTKVIKDLGGYDETTITEDLEIAIRLQKHHYKIVQTFKAITETVAPESWKRLFWQRIRWYKGSVDNAINYKKLIFNKRYGDFGLLRMPTLIASGAIAIILSLTFFYEIIKNLWQNFGYLKSVNFDVLTLVKNFEFSFNLLTLPFFKIIVGLTLVCLSFFIMIYAFKVVGEKISNHGRTWVSFLAYLTVYSIFLSIVWLKIATIFITRKKNQWF